MTPALAATKALWRRIAVTPTTEATLTMRPPPWRDHRPRGGPAHQVEAVEIDADDAMPLLGREGIDVDAILEGVDAGIVDQDVEPAEGVERRRDRLLDRRPRRGCRR